MVVLTLPSRAVESGRSVIAECARIIRRDGSLLNENGTRKKNEIVSCSVEYFVRAGHPARAVLEGRKKRGEEDRVKV